MSKLIRSILIKRLCRRKNQTSMSLFHPKWSNTQACPQYNTQWLQNKLYNSMNAQTSLYLLHSRVYMSRQPSLHDDLNIYIQTVQLTAHKQVSMKTRLPLNTWTITNTIHPAEQTAYKTHKYICRERVFTSIPTSLLFTLQK